MANAGEQQMDGIGASLNPTGSDAQADPSKLTGKRILVVDDEPDILSLLDEYLSSRGYAVVTARCGREALERSSCDPDLVILDVGLPDEDGFSVCRRLRAHLDCPIIFLTARIEDADALTGFEVGGDDYVLKPFSLALLGARVRAHLLREERRQNRARVRFAGDVVIDYRGRTISVANVPVSLTKREFDIVALLSKSPGQVFERELIHERVCGWDSESDAAVITEHVRRIRNKLAAAGPRADPIETIWGMGYRWRA